MITFRVASARYTHLTAAMKPHGGPARNDRRLLTSLARQVRAWSILMVISVTIPPPVAHAVAPAAHAGHNCSLGTYWTGDECVEYTQRCPPAQVFDGRTCVPAPPPPRPDPIPSPPAAPPPAPMPSPPPGPHHCQLGTRWNGDECVPYTQHCPTKQVFNGRECVPLPVLGPPRATWYATLPSGVPIGSNGVAVESLNTRQDGVVDLDGCAALSGDPHGRLFVAQWSWTINRGAGDEHVEGDRGQCRLQLVRPLTSTWTTWIVTLAITRSDGVPSQPETHAVRFRDMLIASLGDSAASGEGVPDVSGTAPVWAGEGGARCDRSGRAASARAASKIETGHAPTDLTSVTLWHLACSGAAITDPDLASVADPRERAAQQYGHGGLLTPYDGESRPTQPRDLCNPFAVPPRVLPSCHPPLPAQIDQLSQLMREAGRQPDAVLLAAGANDVGWSDLAKMCYPWFLGGVGDGACLQPHYVNPIFKRLDGLPARYASLAAALRGANIRADTVFLTEYWDPTHDDRPGIVGGPYAWYCPNDPFVPSGGTRRWAYYNLVVPMNTSGRDAAALHGWHFIGGVQAAFNGHGLCAADNWIVSPEASRFVVEGTVNGGWHANALGQEAIARLIMGALRPVLGPNVALGRQEFSTLPTKVTLRGPGAVGRADHIIARADHLAPGRYRLMLSRRRGMTERREATVCVAQVGSARRARQKTLFTGRMPTMMTCRTGQHSKRTRVAVGPGRYVLGVVGSPTVARRWHGSTPSPARILHVTS
jgi:hypothetical protein